VPAEKYIDSLKSNPEYSYQFHNSMDASTSKSASSIPTPPGLTNPWAKKTWNLTQQGQVYKANPALARQLAEQAGVTLKIM
ncbi:MAG: hypothetical protein AAFY15_00525, partial [Cyanobacteria bacterium J06648_11]